MPLGNNKVGKLIQKTVDDNEGKKINVVKERNISIGSKKSIISTDPEYDTFGTKKMTFYVKEGILDKLYNFAYWDRHSVTQAFNIALVDGLEGKNTRNRPSKRDLSTTQVAG